MRANSTSYSVALDQKGMSSLTHPVCVRMQFQTYPCRSRLCARTCRHPQYVRVQAFFSFLVYLSQASMHTNARARARARTHARTHTHTSTHIHTSTRTHPGNYSAQMYRMEAEDLVARHQSEFPTSPMFLFYAFQNVHAPLDDNDMPDMEVCTTHVDTYSTYT